MVSQERNRRPLVIGFVGVALALVGLAALLPSAAGRRTADKERLLAGLQRVIPPKSVGEAPIAYRWQTPYGSAPETRRTVRMHDFAELGVPLPKWAGPLNETVYVTGTGDFGSTSLHLMFNPDETTAMKLALAYALGSRRNDYGVQQAISRDVATGVAPSKAIKSRSVANILAQIAKGSLPTKERTALQESLQKDARFARSFAPGTRLYEVDGRFYRAKDSKALAMRSQEIVEALGDPLVRLP